MSGDRHIFNAAPDLYETLRKLVAEVEGLGIADEAIRRAVGNTNYVCLMRRVDEARDALLKAQGYVKAEG